MITYLIAGIAIMWLLCLVWFAWMCHTAPEGEEIDGVGFVERGQLDGQEFVQGNDGGEQVKKWRERYG